MTSTPSAHHGRELLAAGDPLAAERELGALVDGEDAPREELELARLLLAAGAAGARYGDTALAARRLERACTLFEGHPDAHEELAEALFTLGNAYQYGDRNAEARAPYDRGKAIGEAATSLRAVMRGDFEIGTMIADSASDDARTHLRACVRACEELADDAAWLFGHSAAVALHRLDADPLAVLAAAERAVATRARCSDPASVDLGEEHAALAWAYVDADRIDDARAAFEHAFAIFGARLGAGHARTRELVTWFAGWEAAKVGSAPAEALLSRHLDAVVAAHGEGDVRTFEVLDAIGNFHWGRERWDDAWPWYLRAIASGSAALGPLHPRMVSYRSNIASSFDNHGKTAAIVALFAATLESLLVALDDENAAAAYEVARSLEMYLARAGDMEGRRVWVERFLAACEARLPVTHPVLLDALSGSIDSLPFAATGFEPLVRRGIALFEPFADRAPHRLEIALARLVNELAGPPHAAERRATLRRLVELWETQFSAERPSLPAWLSNYAGELPEPERKALYERVIALVERTLGPTHEHLGFLYREMGVAVPSFALEARIRSLAILEAASGATSLHCAGAQAELAEQLEAEAEAARATTGAERTSLDAAASARVAALLQQAEGLRRKAFEIYRAQVGNDPWRCAGNATSLADNLRRQNKDAEGRAILEAAERALCSCAGPLGQVLRALGAACDRAGDLEGMARAYEKGAAAYARSDASDANAAAQCELDWARALVARGQHSAAADIFARLEQRIDSGRLAADLSRLTYARRELADAAFAAGELTRAMHGYERLLLSPNDASRYERASATLRLAAIYGTGRGSVKAATELFEGAIAMLAIVLGEDHPEVEHAREGLTKMLRARATTPQRATTAQRATRDKPLSAAFERLMAALATTSERARADVLYDASVDDSAPPEWCAFVRLHQHLVVRGGPAVLLALASGEPEDSELCRCAIAWAEAHATRPWLRRIGRGTARTTTPRVRTVETSAYLVALHPNERWFATHDGIVWDVETGTRLPWTFSEPGSSAMYGREFAWSSDGRRFVALEHERVRVFDGVTGGCIARFPIAADAHVLAICAGAKRAAIGWKDGAVRTLDLTSGALADAPFALRAQPTSLAFDRDGVLLAAGVEDATAWLWNSAGAEPPFILDQVSHSWRVKRGCVVRFSADGARLSAFVVDVGLKVFDVATRAPLATLPFPHGAVLGLDADATFAVAYSAADWSQPDQALERYDLTTSARVAGVALSSPHNVTHVFARKDGSVVMLERYHALSLWQLGDKSREERAELHESTVRAVAALPDGKRVATLASRDARSAQKTLRLIDIASGACRTRIDGSRDDPHALWVTPDGSRAIAWDRHRTSLEVFGLKRGVPRHLEWTGHTAHIRAVATTPDVSLVLTGGEDRSVRAWRADGKRASKIIRLPAVPNALAVSPDGRTFALGDRDGTVSLGGIAPFTALRTTARATSWVTALAFLAPNALVSMSMFGELALWDVRDGACVANERLAYKGDSFILPILGGSGFLFQGPNGFEVWDVATFARRGSIERASTPFAVHPGGRSLLGGTGHAQPGIGVWDLATLACVATWPTERELAACSFTAGGLAICALHGGEFLTLQLCDGPPSKAARAARPRGKARGTAGRPGEPSGDAQASLVAHPASIAAIDLPPRRATEAPKRTPSPAEERARALLGEAEAREESGDLEGAATSYGSAHEAAKEAALDDPLFDSALVQGLERLTAAFQRRG